MWLENGGNPVRVQGSPDGGTEGLRSLEMGNKETQVRLVGQDNSSERWIVHRGQNDTNCSKVVSGEDRLENQG